MPLKLDDPNDPLPRRFGPQAGVVVDRDDPRGLGRIRVRVPGVQEPHGPWALPLGTLGAGPGIGAWWIPETGTEVVILFKNGNPDFPYYLTSNWTVGSVPGEALDEEGKGDPRVRVLATPTYAIVLDERPESAGLKLLHRTSGDVVEYDNLARQWSIIATASIALRSLGQVDISAPIITLNGRTVLPTGDPI